MKRAGRVMLHAGGVILALLLLLAVPAWRLGAFSGLFGSNTDAISSASIDLPDQPSGDFLVLIRTSSHQPDLDAWQEFFTGGEFTVIFDDLRCLVAQGDVTGREMAERYQLQLPENQMTLREENATLLASKTEAGMIDVAVFSREMAESLDLQIPDSLTLIEVKGNAS